MADDAKQAEAPAIVTSKTAKRLDETIPGGSYFAADGTTRINAHGQKIDARGNVLED